jgi:GTPase SAR1 family protein
VPKQQVAPAAGSIGNTDYNIDNNSSSSIHANEAVSTSEEDTAPNTSAKVVADTVDNSEVLKLLEEFDGLQDGDNMPLRMSIFDFGGQDVFSAMHHLFLNKHSVYILLFNMHWLASDDVKEREMHLAFMRFWLNSIAMHTNGIAKVIIAGTRKDEVSDPATHHKISNILMLAFCGMEFWGNVVENSEGVGANGSLNLVFWPVNNLVGNKDPVIRQIQQKIEAELRASSFVSAQRPLTWSSALDVVKEVGKTDPVISYEKIRDICLERCQIEPEKEFPKLLEFLNDAGVVFWLQEVSMRDTVVIDVKTAFVKPMTLVICKHIQNSINDLDRSHSEPVHKLCQKNHYSDWLKMISKGIVSEVLLRALLQDYKETWDYVVKLMAKFGLLVAMETFSSDPSVKEDYLVPSLLPVRPSQIEEEGGDVWQHSCFFVFNSSQQQMDDLAEDVYITSTRLRDACFLPHGLFERLLVKFIEWCQLTSVQKPKYTIHRDVATLMFGGQELQLQLLSDIHCIRLSVNGANPAAMLNRVSQQLDKVIVEVMEKLRFLVLLPLSKDSKAGAVVEARAEEMMFTPLVKLQTMATGGSTNLRMSAGKRGALLNHEEITRLVGVWTPTIACLPRYHLFLSYRWGLNDSLMTAALFDTVSGFEVDGNTLDVFLDTQRLQNGEQLQTQFAGAMANSTMVAAFVSSYALQRMLTHKVFLQLIHRKFLFIVVANRRLQSMKWFIEH